MEITKETRQFVGEVRRSSDGRLRMCAMVDAEFGGGKGHIWVIEQALYTFKLKKVKRQFTGICTSVYPSEKSMRLLLTEGNTWGLYQQGYGMNIDCENLEYIFPVDLDRPQDYNLDMLKQLRSEARISFYEQLQSDLEQSIAGEHSQYLTKLIGDKEYKDIKALIRAFVCLSMHARRQVIDGVEKPTTALKSYQNGLLWQLKQLKEGKQ